MRFVFVGGCERSGTTLVQRLLAAHSGIVGGPEFVFTPHVAELYERMSADYPAPWAERVHSHFTVAELRSSFRDFYSRFFDSLRASKPEALYLSEKTPGNIRVARSLLELFPDAIFLHVLRDGRDVVASHRAVLRRSKMQADTGIKPGGFAVRAVSRRWNSAVDAHFDLESDRLLSPRYLALRYEDLVGNPESTLGDLLSALGLEVERHLLNPEQLGGDGPSIPVDGAWVTDEMLARPFDTGSVGRWRRDLGTAQRIAAGWLMRHNLRRIEQAPPSPVRTRAARPG